MKTSIEVESRKEAEAISNGLSDPATRAFVVVMGALSALPSDRARMRVLAYVQDYFDERDGKVAPMIKQRGYGPSFRRSNFGPRRVLMAQLAIIAASIVAMLLLFSMMGLLR